MILSVADRSARASACNASECQPSPTPPRCSQPAPPKTQTSVNLAHLHPDFEIPAVDDSDSPELQAYKMKKGLSRRSPYPTLVIEARTVEIPELPPDEEQVRVAAPQRIRVRLLPEAFARLRGRCSLSR